MIATPDSTNIGGGTTGLSVPGTLTIGKAAKVVTPPDYLFIQNDSANTSTLPYYVAQTDSAHYVMQKATAPRSGQYIGVFLWSGATNTRGARVTDAKWTTSDATVASIVQTTSNGQAVVNILKAGTAKLTVTSGTLSSTLTITAT